MKHPTHCPHCGEPIFAPENMTIGGRVRTARINKRWNHTQLAEAIGLRHGNNLAALESNANTPRIETIQKLASALDVDPAWLAFGTSNGKERAE